MSKRITAQRIKISGRVQGIGFRPYIYRLAHRLGLSGWVLNNQEGVIIHLEGSETAIKNFLATLPTEAPPLTHIESMETFTTNPEGMSEFTIRSSELIESTPTIQVQPDIATCEKCLKELFSPADRRYLYPFINCTNCGPRFTIIKDVPYDRSRTTMSEFQLCRECWEEYTTPQDRRYHAQPNACWECGPQVQLLRKDGTIVQSSDPVQTAARLLAEGKIIAIKGIGGYHLACDALNDNAVRQLRQRKYREDKPFAVMMPDIETVKFYCEVSEAEINLLSSYKSPIVLLRRRTPSPQPEISPGVAPQNPWLGVMLPYTPLHHLLFHQSGLKVLVMTSGNLSQEPIAYEDDDALRRLSEIADYFLTHNREIQRRVDDSVVRIINGREYLLRRARGYAPVPIVLQRPVKRILAVGAELKNTFCIGRNNLAYLSHHLGDLENLETYSAFVQGIEDFKRLFQLQPEYVTYDMHPDYLSTKYALQESGLPGIRIQHHHAHIASLLAEYGLREKIIGFAFDGTGYGPDETIWGGEVLIADLQNYQRFATLLTHPMPGGTQAIKEPWRMGAVYLWSIYGEELWKLDIPFVRNLLYRKWQLLLSAMKKQIHSPLTTSIGRLFDGISAILGICHTVNYEGQAAMELEFCALTSTDGRVYPFELLQNESPIKIDFRPALEAILTDIKAGTEPPKIARSFHQTIARIIEELAKLARKETGINTVGLSGGCFQNYLLLTESITRLENAGFKVLIHRLVPPNDGGISLGQLVIADALI